MLLNKVINRVVKDLGGITKCHPIAFYRLFRRYEWFNNDYFRRQSSFYVRFWKE